MKATHIASSNIDAVGYKLGQLIIRFHSGAAYAYDAVPFAIYDGLRLAESAGKYFHREIKGRFTFQKLDSDPFGNA